MSAALDLADDALLCLGLFGPIAPLRIAWWFQPPEWAPVMGEIYFSFVPPDGFVRRPFPETAAADSANHYAAWRALPESRRDELRVPMQRLNRAMRRANPVDAAIDLGIALESIFLRDLSADRGELTFRLRVRAARWLGTTPDERTRLSTLLAGVYAIRSKAVHHGRVPETKRSRPTTELLQDGYDLAARALIKLISEGDPDWEAITFC